MTKSDKIKQLKSSLKNTKAQLKRREAKIARLEARNSQLEAEAKKKEKDNFLSVHKKYTQKKRFPCGRTENASVYSNLLV